MAVRMGRNLPTCAGSARPYVQHCWLEQQLYGPADPTRGDARVGGGSGPAHLGGAAATSVRDRMRQRAAAISNRALYRDILRNRLRTNGDRLHWRPASPPASATGRVTAPCRRRFHGPGAAVIRRRGPELGGTVLPRQRV